MVFKLRSASGLKDVALRSEISAKDWRFEEVRLVEAGVGEDIGEGAAGEMRQRNAANKEEAGKEEETGVEELSVPLM